jgi:HK97 gp10 family phage protein
MANVVVSIDGLDALRAMLKGAPKKARKLMRTMLKESAEAVAAHARNTVHEDRGDLKAAITVNGRGLSWAAGIEKRSTPITSRGRVVRGTSTAHLYPHVYGWFEEFGTNDTPAHPFMKPAAEAEGNLIPGRLRAVAAGIESKAVA